MPPESSENNCGDGRGNSSATIQNMQRLKQPLEMLASIVVVAGVPLFFAQQHAEEKRARIERTIGFSLQLQAGELSAARIGLTEPWTAYDLSRLKDQGLSKLAAHKLVRDIAATHPQVKTSLIRLGEFYDSVSLCVRSGACDDRTAQELFRPYATQLLALYLPVVEDLRSSMQSDSFGCGLASLTELGASILPACKLDR